MKYFVMEEDPTSEFKIFLGNVNLRNDQRLAMLLCYEHYISRSPLTIDIKYCNNTKMSDYLSTKFPLISQSLKDALEEFLDFRLFSRDTYLNYQDSFYLYYYFVPNQYDSIDYKLSHYERDVRAINMIRIREGGFVINSEAVKDCHIFRVRGLSNRTLVVSEKLKNYFEERSLKGITYTDTRNYKD